MLDQRKKDYINYCIYAVLVSVLIFMYMYKDRNNTHFYNAKETLIIKYQIEDIQIMPKSDFDRHLILMKRKLKDGTDGEDPVDPCVDFYEFACGSYAKFDPQFNFDQNTFLTVETKLNKDLEKIISGLKGEEGVFGLVETFYKACTNWIAVENGILDLKELLKTMSGGYPMLEQNWNGDTFEWSELMRQFREVGVSVGFLFGLLVQPDFNFTNTRKLMVCKT